METIILEAKKRTIIGKQVKTLRQRGVVPAAVYGHGVDTRNIEVDGRAFEKVYSRTGESGLVDLVVDSGAPVKVLIQDVSYEPLLGGMAHIDFRQVNMKETLEAEVTLRFVGEAPAVKEIGALLIRSMDKITVRCLPQNLVNEIEVNISKLKKFDDNIKVKDITPPAGIEFKANPEDLIIAATEPMSEEEMTALEAKPVADVSTVKVETEEKKAAKAAAEAEAEEKK